MKKQNLKNNTVDCVNVLVSNPSGSCTKARRVRQRAIREEVSENHGSSKRVKTTIETCIESLEHYNGVNRIHVPTIQSDANIIDADIVVDADYEEITDRRQATEAKLKELPEVSKVESASNPQSEEERLKKEMALQAREMLGINELTETGNDMQMSTSGKQVLSFFHEREINTSGELIVVNDRCSSEYREDPLFTQNLDFSIFEDYDKFKNKICLTGKSLKDCIVTYNKTKFKIVKDRAKLNMLLTYILILEKTNNIVLKPEIIGSHFLYMFEYFLYNYGLAPSTISNLCCMLKQIIKWASHHGVVLQPDIDDWKYKPIDAKPKIALTEEDLMRIYWFDIKTLPFRPQKIRTLERVRDHFIISCYLGQRFSDASRFDQANFRGSSKEIFEITQQKTGSHATLKFDNLYHGGIPECARKILEKYDYQSPWHGHISNYNRYLHELMQHIGFNESIKHEYKVHGKLVTKYYQKWELISSHSSRRTFITCAVKRNVNSQIIKKASGHQSDKSFGKYVILDY